MTQEDVLQQIRAMVLNHWSMWTLPIGYRILALHNGIYCHKVNMTMASAMDRLSDRIVKVSDLSLRGYVFPKEVFDLVPHEDWADYFTFIRQEVLRSKGIEPKPNREIVYKVGVGTIKKAGVNLFNKKPIDTDNGNGNVVTR